MGIFIKGTWVGIALILASVNSQVQAQDLVINDFQDSGFEFDYGSWTGNLTIGPDFLTVNATESGGGGANSFQSASSLSLSPGPTYFIEIDVRKVSGNLADAFNVILEDGDGTMAGWKFDLSTVDEIEFHTLNKTLTPDFFNPPSKGTADGVFDQSSIVGWQVQGDFSSEDTLALQFKNLVIIPEPSSLALLATGILGLISLSQIRKST